MAQAFLITLRNHPEHCKLNLKMCNPDKFAHVFALREAYYDNVLETVYDLAHFLDQTGVLAFLDRIKIDALLEINKVIIPKSARPRIYYEVLGRYFMLEFQPDQNDILFGRLPISANLISAWSEFEDSIPELGMWEYISIKSMY
jgi:hypothetical protein